MGERALLLAANEADEPRQTRYDWRRGGVPWYVLGPLYVARVDSERNLPHCLRSGDPQWGPEMVETINKLVRIHKEQPENWRAIKRMVDAFAKELPMRTVTLKRKPRPEIGNP